MLHKAFAAFALSLSLSTAACVLDDPAGDGTDDESDHMAGEATFLPAAARDDDEAEITVAAEAPPDQLATRPVAAAGSNPAATSCKGEPPSVACPVYRVDRGDQPPVQQP